MKYLRRQKRKKIDLYNKLQKMQDIQQQEEEEQEKTLTNYQKKRGISNEIQRVNYLNQDMLEKLLKMQQFENQGTLSKIVNEFINGPNSTEIIDPRDAITMVSVGGMFVMACAMLLMMAIQGMFIKKLMPFL